MRETEGNNIEKEEEEKRRRRRRRRKRKKIVKLGYSVSMKQFNDLK